MNHLSLYPSHFCQGGFIKNQVMQRDQANSFGHQRLADFYLDPGYVNVNHGSYGSCPRKVVAAKRKW